MPSMRRAFDKMLLEEYLICFKMYGDCKKYICFVGCGICNMYGYFVWNVFVKYMEVWEIWRINIVNTWTYSHGLCVGMVFFVLCHGVMLLSKKGDFVRQIEKDM